MYFIEEGDDLNPTKSALLYCNTVIGIRCSIASIFVPLRPPKDDRRIRCGADESPWKTVTFQSIMKSFFANNWEIVLEMVHRIKSCAAK